MSMYEQHLKHFKNHSKDRFYQQCASGIGANSTETVPEPKEGAEKESFLRLLQNAKPEDFPICIKQIGGGIYVTTDRKDGFGTVLASMDEMQNYFKNYVG